MTLRDKLLDILEKYPLKDASNPNKPSDWIIAKKFELLEELLIALEEHGE